MTDMDLNKRQSVLTDTMDQLSLPSVVKEEVLQAAGQKIASAIRATDGKALQLAVDEAWVAIGSYYREQLSDAMQRWVAEDKISAAAAERMLDRVPNTPGEEFSGLDAGVAAGLGIVPEDKQDLIRSLHAFYTPDAVDQVRQELAAGLTADQETTWWLAMCSECIEGQVDARQFVSQLAGALEIRDNPELRVQRAQEEIEMMTASLDRVEAGVGYGTVDGCIQGAYLNNCDIGVSDMRDIGAPIFVGTFRGSEVNLDTFSWGTTRDDRGRAMSGQIAPGFYKVADEAERDRLVKELKAQLNV